MPRPSRSRLQLTDEQKKQRRRKQKRESIRRARAKMDEAALEERRRKDRERYKLKKERGEIKSISDFTPREQRQLRKTWREKAKKRREKNKLLKNVLNLTPPSSHLSSPSSRSRVNAGKKVSARNRRRLKIENSYLRSRLNEIKKKVNKYRMRFTRLTKKFEKLKKDTKIPKRSTKDKKGVKTRKIIHDFLLNDENSRLTSGKKETITRHKVKKQIRLLNDLLLNLHKAFVNKTGIKLSYETFRRNRPFWVLSPDAAARNTCLCALHTNTEFIFQALRRAKLITFKTLNDMIRSLCCNNSLKEACLERKCPNCKDKVIEVQCSPVEENDTLSYERWITKPVTVIIKGKSKTCRKTMKERVACTKQGAIDLLDSNLPIFMQHVANYRHQLKVIEAIKQQMSPSDGLLHIDFSENYNCKYNEEVQSAHFGGSKAQLSLHTSVYYSTDSDPPTNYVKATSMCTISENLNHDPILICAHLNPIIERIKMVSPHLKHLHILSDGPSTQYRNKSMFYLISQYIGKEIGVDTITWHYSEKGHGKGAPDGVRGCIKRVADKSVALGNDVSNLDDLMSCLKTNIKKIEVYPVNETIIPDIQKIADKNATRPFKGTFNVHQLTWTSKEPTTIHARRLSCLVCAAHVTCPHYEIGQIHIQSRISHSPDISAAPDYDVFNERPAASSNSGSPGMSAAPDYDVLNAGPAHLNFLHSPRRSETPDSFEEPNALVDFHMSDSRINLATPDAPTVPNTPSPPKTPEISTVAQKHNTRPIKRGRRIFSDESDKENEDIHMSKQRRVVYSSDSDGDDDYAIF